jgi:oxygen-dependent protoporphyrinogen oxidase
MVHQRTDVAIIGAGISGLSLAHWLRKQGVEVIVLEKDSDVGGTMKTVRESGYLVETGPNSALETTPLIKELVTDCALESEFQYANPSSKNRYILKNGKLVRLPLSPPAFLGSKLFSLSAKLRLLKEPFIGRAEKEESVAQFVERRLGREFLDYAIDPFVAGIFAGRPEALSVRAAFPKLYALERDYGGLIKGMLGGRKVRKAREEKAKDRAETFSFKNGMQVFPRALAGRPGTRVLVDAQVEAIGHEQPGTPPDEDESDRYSVVFRRRGSDFALHARSLVLSVPAYVAATLIRTISPSTSDLLSSIYYPPVASLFAAYRRSDIRGPVDGFGFLVPSRERRQILGSLWSSSLFEGRAPEGTVGMTTFVGGGRQPDLVNRDEKELCDLALTDLENIMQIEGKNVYSRVTRWQKSIPQYEIGYLSIVEALERCERQFPGLYFCSNFKGGISVGDCVKSSFDTAHRIVSSLKNLNHQRH